MSSSSSPIFLVIHFQCTGFLSFAFFILHAGLLKILIFAHFLLFESSWVNSVLASPLLSSHLNPNLSFVPWTCLSHCVVSYLSQFKFMMTQMEYITRLQLLIVELALIMYTEVPSSTPRLHLFWFSSNPSPILSPLLLQRTSSPFQLLLSQCRSSSFPSWLPSSFLIGLPSPASSPSSPLRQDDLTENEEPDHLGLHLILVLLALWPWVIF